MICVYSTPSENLIANAILIRWIEAKQKKDSKDGFNQIISNAAKACGVSYERAEELSKRAVWHISKDKVVTLPSFGR